MESAAEITKRSGSNLALAFVALPKKKRAAMVSLYAFCREVDDIADDVDVSATERERELSRWREALRDRYREGATASGIGVIDELEPTIRDYNLRLEDFEALLDGVESDILGAEFRVWDDLETYCYRVASAVGLLSIPIFGYSHPETRDYAIALGKALQLTNILRDVAEDAEIGRVYLPESLLNDYRLSREDVLRRRYGRAYARMALEVADRATAFYAEANRALPDGDRRSMVAAELMGAVYWELLERLRQREFDVFNQPRARLTKAQKLWKIAVVSLRTIALRSRRPNYGPKLG